MKTHIKNPLTLSTLIIALVLILAGQVTAQVFTTLHSFTGGSDGANPFGGMVLSGSTLYGTTVFGGGSGYGTLFSINTNGTGFKVLQSFNGVNNEAYPETTLLLSGNTLYGASGGPGLSSTLFAVNTNGRGFTTRYTFTPVSGPSLTNRDGANTFGAMILSGNTLYGMTEYGGSSGWGTVYAINTNGTGFTTLHSFTGGSDGGWPLIGPLTLSGNTLYGTTIKGGSGSGNSGNGTVFAINTDGTGFTTLHIFTATNALHINSDGASPSGGVISSGNTLYGTTQFGGNSGNGTVYAVNTDGTDFTTLHSFAAQPNLSTGVIPSGGVILSGNTLYGTTHSLGISGKGTLFSLSFRPQLTAIPSETNLVLTWPTNYAGFDYTGYTLQTTTNLGSFVAWTTNSLAPVIVNGQNTMTNPISGTQGYFRLRQ